MKSNIGILLSCAAAGSIVAGGIAFSSMNNDAAPSAEDYHVDVAVRAGFTVTSKESSPSSDPLMPPAPRATTPKHPALDSKKVGRSHPTVWPRPTFNVLLETGHFRHVLQQTTLRYPRAQPVRFQQESMRPDRHAGPEPSRRHQPSQCPQCTQ